MKQIDFKGASGIKDPIVESLPIRPDDFNRFLKTLSPV
jgi:hypothetical protein